MEHNHHSTVGKLMTAKQRQALSISVVVVFLFAAYFFKDYFFLIALGGIIAYLFNPIYKWLLKKTNQRVWLSIALTLMTSIITVGVPLAIVTILTVEQALQMVDDMTKSINSGSDIGAWFQGAIDAINRTIAKLPGHSFEPITTEQPLTWLNDNASRLLQYSIGWLTIVAGGVTSFFAKVVVYAFVFTSFLRNQDKIVHALKRLNPLGEKATNMYLERMAAMTSAMVKGQLIIAIIQSLVDVLLLWLVGVNYLFIWFVLITFFSIIPLGGGVLVIPIGIVLILTGHIWEGIVLILGHVVVVGNIDNVLRPRFVPKRARLDSALLILSVFAGISMFGFMGLVVGPVITIALVSTIQVYIAAADRDAKIEAQQKT